MISKPIIVAAVVAVGAGALFFFMQPNSVQPGSGEPLVEVAIPELSLVEEAGKTIYDANCASCHGANAAGQEEVAPPLVHRIYEPNHHADGAFYSAVQIGVRAHHWTFGDMPAVMGVTQRDVAKVIAYVRALQRENGIQ